MDDFALHTLTWLGVSGFPSGYLSPSWSWKVLLVPGLALFASARLILYVLEGVQADAKKDAV